MGWQVVPRGDGLVDVWLAAGDPEPYFKLDGRVEFRLRMLGVRGVDPEDPRYGGDLERHVREHYSEWLAGAEWIDS